MGEAILHFSGDTSILNSTSIGKFTNSERNYHSKILPSPASSKVEQLECLNLNTSKDDVEASLNDTEFYNITVDTNASTQNHSLGPCQTSEQKEKRKRKKTSNGISDDDDEEVLNHTLNDGSDSCVNDATDLDVVISPLFERKIIQEDINEYENMRAMKEIPQDLKSRLIKGRWSHKNKSSIYVDAFNLALETVLEDERHLFDWKELYVFDHWRELNYEAQYLYVRLFLRKSSVWHRISSLNYFSDSSDLTGAVNALQCSQNLYESSTVASTVPSENLDKLFPLKFMAEQDAELESSFNFADSSAKSITTLEEASSLLSLEELKIISKEAKIGGGCSVEKGKKKNSNKAELLEAILKISKSQTGLAWCNDSRKGNFYYNEPGSFLEPENNASLSISTRNDTLLQHFFKKVMKIIGPCIRLSLPSLKLFERVHLIYYRSTQWTEKSFITMILTQISRRNFPRYIVSRSANIFSSRAHLLEFEVALKLQSQVDDILQRMNSQKELERVLEIFDQVYPRWKTLLTTNDGQLKPYYFSPQENNEGAYISRFSPAWVYTRILHKSAYVLGRLKDYEREYVIISELLNQTRFHPARRGAWYQRKALLEENYMFRVRPLPDISNIEIQKKYWKRVSLQTCETGLQDKYCHQIYHYDLQKRVCKLEKNIKIPKREKHDFGHVLLSRPTEVWIEGIQVLRDSSRSIKSTSNSSSKRYLNIHNEKSIITKTIWINEFEGGGECSVEAMCLSSYRSRGYKGYHAEGGIIHTLFAYLFYDILFTYVPNVFQTSYQSCPLDLHTDAFYPSRVSEINHRLVEIENGCAATIIKAIDAEERPRRTCIIGLNWDFQIDNLLEIVDCFNRQALAVICRVLAQEYHIRRSGMPDLFLWHVERREVIFSEVKSVNDRLSETQRLWIHILTGAGLRVELCHAVAKEVRRVDNE